MTILNQGHSKYHGTTRLIQQLLGWTDLFKDSVYLRPAIEETQLMFYSRTQALKTVFDSFTSETRATAIAVSTLVVEYTISATKDAIVSARVFHTPQLPIVPDIGPRLIFETFDIPVITDLLDVGQNL